MKELEVHITILDDIDVWNDEKTETVDQIITETHDKSIVDDDCKIPSV